MKAIILVGGLGTRLRPLTWNTPKSLVPVLNRPFLEYVLRNLKQHGVDDIVLALSNLASPIQECFGDGHKLGIQIEYAIEESALGTAGAIKNAAANLTSAPFFVLNGDIFSNLDYGAMLNFHLKCNSRATIALTKVDNPQAYGLVETNNSLRVTRFIEKPKAEEITTNFINAGTYILEPSVLDLIPPETAYSTERQLFPSMLANDDSVYAFPSEDYWIDIGNPEKYRQLNFDLLSGNGDQSSLHNSEKIVIGRNCQIHPTAKLESPVLIGDNCVVNSNVIITGPTVIGERCRIEEAATISDSVIWQGVTISSGCRVDSSIAAEGCVFLPNCEVRQAVLGDHVTILQNHNLTSGSIVEPGQTIG